MDKVAIALAFSLVAAGAQAQTRPSTVNMPCGASRQLVFTRGAVGYDTSSPNCRSVPTMPISRIYCPSTSRNSQPEPRLTTCTEMRAYE
jgi:hypothetical protein